MGLGSSEVISGVDWLGGFEMVSGLCAFLLMSEKSNTPPMGPVRSLLKILSFLRAYPTALSLTLGLLLINIGIELALPQVLGNALTALQRLQAASVALQGRCAHRLQPSRRP